MLLLQGNSTITYLSRWDFSLFFSRWEGASGAKMILTARLNLQHYLWKDQTGFLLHPTIPLDGRTDLKIADVGTGTGYADTISAIHHPYFSSKLHTWLSA